MLMTLKLERALRWAATRHIGQERKGSGTPYVEHPMGVAMILDRLGFAEDVVIAGLLHDVVEDTSATIDEVRKEFGSSVAEVVHFCSEVKLDAKGRKRPWKDRKLEHLEALDRAPVAAHAVVLADKLHNLTSMQLDLQEGRAVWPTFNAKRHEVLWYYHTMIDRFGEGDPRLEELAEACREVLREVEQYEE